MRGMKGYFRVGQTRTGGWSFIDPHDAPFFACAVAELDAADAAALEPLRAWGFNAVCATRPVDELLAEQIAVIGVAGFCELPGVIRAPGVRVPDVFDPSWTEMAAAQAASVCAPLCHRVELLGWLADDGVAWGVPDGSGRPTLLQICLSLEPGFPAYHAAWEFALASHQGSLSSLAKAWGHPMANREVVRELTRNEQALASRGYARDNARWTREFAQRYFATTAAAIRAHDPNHLLLGSREKCRRREAVSGGASEASLRALGASAAVDVPWVHWRDLPTAAGGPVLAGEFTWASEEFWAPPASGRRSALTSVERMLRKGRATMQRLVSHPAVVGYAWRRWRDQAGERPPFGSGLVHEDGAEAREHTELVTDIHGRIATLRSSMHRASPHENDTR